MSNEWSQPDSPPAPLFTGKKERDLVKQVNDELIEKVIGQAVVYYPIDVDRTNFHDLYGEAIIKTFLPPIRILALVEMIDFKTVYTDNVGVDFDANINVHFHRRRLTEDQDVFVRQGDFVFYGDMFYEIVELSESRLFGQIDHRMEIVARCTAVREGTFNAI
tara:strand:- start:428 stop:913 length:486 start_codon:yes stop_codon:yes gene_type:complete